jgi:hypothetical protein
MSSGKKERKMTNEKRYPEIGEHLYLADWYCATRDPYTVIGISGGRVIVQEARPVFYGVRYFNTLPDDIVADPSGRVLTLSYAPKKGVWKEKGSYGREAVFGKWDYLPYLN